MSADHITRASLENQAFSLMARLHVILRRQTGRITDIEYMRSDPIYCRHVLNLALGTPNDDLPAICARLQEIYFGTHGLFVRTPAKSPLLERLSAAMGETTPAKAASDASTHAVPEKHAEDASQRHHIELNDAVEKGYIGRLR